MNLPKCPPETEVQIGWRWWEVSRGGWLISPYYGGTGWVWPALKPLEARCDRVHATGQTPIPAPMPVCKCGIYATAVSSKTHAAPVFPVRGRVALWGKVLECGWEDGEPRGWRAQYAYPYELFVRASNEITGSFSWTQEKVKMLRNIYRCDVSIEPSPGVVMTD